MPNTYSDFIDRMRGEVGDFPLKTFETADGDGTTSLFQLQNPKIQEDSYTVKISNVVQIEGNSYVVDPDVGQITFSSAAIPPSGNDNVQFSYSSVKERDGDWIKIINNVINRLHKKLWIEVVNETALVTDENATYYDLSTIGANIIYVLGVDYRTSSAQEWQSLKSHVNVFFQRDTQRLYVDPKFPVSDYEIRIRVLRAYVQGTATSSTFEVQEKYWPILIDYCRAEFIRRRAMELMKDTSAVTREKSFQTATEMLRLAREITQQADEKLKTSRPSKPAVQIGIRIG